ncbi:hypothetical protein [Pseudobutyrivibrio ruminis]|uniref:Uncharacterized protein n=1 Tax=Pseudobutyrivibrio ruminis TaxID=46206 RepID=A0A2G3DTR9_9FIRM|nr:hypothetical protein [Pseudobutyrivibrio ruminis]PHU34341.1 hypothetical protein CSX01_10510 [Pseudobutyrivibrio ruminis]
MNEFELLGELHNIIDKNTDEKMKRWLDTHNVNYYLLYPLVSIELGTIKEPPENISNLLKRCISTFIYSRAKQSGKEIYLRNFNTSGFRKYLQSYECDILPLYQNDRFSREINDINPFSKPRLTQTDENKYLLTTSLVSDTYREEGFYFLGLDDSSITEQEKQQVCDFHSLFFSKIFIEQQQIDGLQKCIDKTLFNACVEIVEKDLNKWGARVRSKIFDNPTQLANVIAYFYYHAMIKSICIRLDMMYVEDYFDIGKDCILMLQKQKCIKDIVDISGAPEIKVKEIVEYLINDGRMNLLEFPLFEVEDKIITIPSAILVNDWQFTIVNGHYIKNIPITNREKTISTVTERHIEKALKGVQNVAVAKTVPYSFIDENGEKQCSDIDYAIYDMSRNILLVIEAKWIDKHYKDEIDKRYGMILKTLNDIYSKQIEKHKTYLSKKSNIDNLFKDDARYNKNLGMPQIIYLAVDKRNQLHIDDKHMVSEFMLIYFLKTYTKNGQLDLSAMWNEIDNLKTKVEYIKVSDDYYEIPIGENIVLVEKADLSWE